MAHNRRLRHEDGKVKPILSNLGDQVSKLIIKSGDVAHCRGPGFSSLSTASK